MNDKPAEGHLAEVEQADPGSLGVELPEDSDAAVAVLIEALATARRTSDAYLDDLQRVAAEYENYRKRSQREREEVVLRASQRVVEALLPVLDSFDHAFAFEAATESEAKLLAGLRSTFHQLTDVLGKEGLEIIPTVGEPFDPAVHEAVAGGGSGELVVAEELRRGYRLEGRVLRPAMVRVSDGGAEGSDD